MILLAEGRAGLDAQFAAGDPGTGMMQAVEKELIDKKLFALMNREGHTDAGQVDVVDGIET
jgi:hypothetical protein